MSSKTTCLCTQTCCLRAALSRLLLFLAKILPSRTGLVRHYGVPLLPPLAASKPDLKMRLIDRFDAGKQLALRLKKYKNDPDAIVIALPRGGVIIGYEVAKELSLPLDITCPRKIGAPGNLEFAVGAITETGQGILHDDVIESLQISKEYLKRKIAEETEVAKNRLLLYREGREKRDLKGKTVLIVDDGLATGSTMQAAIISIKSEGAGKIVLAIPVSPPHALDKFEGEADEIICLMTPPGFYAVGQFYDNFAPVGDNEVITLLQKSTSNK